MKAVWNGAVLAQSDHTRVVEGNHYFPPESLDRACFKDSTYTTECGWKGTASYYTVEVEGKLNRDSAWYYAEPKDAAAEIKGYVAFWRGVEVIE